MSFQARVLPYSLSLLFSIFCSALALADGRVIPLQTDHIRKDSMSSGTVIDLVTEIWRAAPDLKGQLIQIQSVELTAKSAVGGGAFFLRINGEYLETQSIETDSDDFDQTDQNAVSLTLNNIKADNQTPLVLHTAELVISGTVHITALSITVGDAVALQWKDSSSTNGEVPPALSPDPANTILNDPMKSNVPALAPVIVPALNPVVVTPSAPAPTVPVVPVAVRPAPVAPATCFSGFCIGDQVSNPHLSMLKGQIVGVYPAQGQLAVKWAFKSSIAYVAPNQVNKD